MIRYRLHKEGPELVLTVTPVGSPSSIHTREAGATDIFSALEQNTEIKNAVTLDSTRSEDRGIRRWTIKWDVGATVHTHLEFVVDAPRVQDALDMFMATRAGMTVSVSAITCVYQIAREYEDLKVKFEAVKREPRFTVGEAPRRVSRCEECGNDYSEDYCPHPHKSREAPEQAWARAATLMRSMIQTHGKIPDDDPVWGVEIPEYRPPGAL